MRKSAACLFALAAQHLCLTDPYQQRDDTVLGFLTWFILVQLGCIIERFVPQLDWRVDLTRVSRALEIAKIDERLKQVELYLR